MDNIDKRKIVIGAAIVVGLFVLIFLGKWLIRKREATKEAARLEQVRKEKQKQAEAEARQTRLLFHQVCQYADSVGIDTSRYVNASKRGALETEETMRQLLLEARYGKKPSRLEFSGLQEAVDSAWADKVKTLRSTQPLISLTTFRPYTQLVGHYNRLRKKGRNNPTVADSLRLIRQTLNFYRYVNRFDPDRFVMVNIPAGELNVFDRNGKRLLPMQVITGKPDRKTPCMTTYIRAIVAYPYWNVPQNIALEEILPHIKRDLAYLNNQNFQVLNDKGVEVDPEKVDWDEVSETNFPYRIRQASGCENSLGLLKFELVNPLAIYLHDTNSRDLFTLTKDRWRSHGCVRVQKPVELANLVLGAETFDDEFMNKCLIDQKPRSLPIAKPFPVFITYNVADVDAAGKLKFFKDVYGEAK
ncbi:L,D-transpeptidase family protein [Spirosoma sp. BT702]|uniref:L,D-transpeptidase family protein n=1 Tax=Spirosoma profusum TaxID=2771354 RepID=A0A927AR83_9BACT|nr:L,D-transpeptidase family protein [Spirosoma profusum]MBD2701938.1 L,D-transpeptidase family protein [Spirosoma profusum]